MSSKVAPADPSEPLAQAKAQWFEANRSKLGDIPKLVDLNGYEHKLLYTPADVRFDYGADLGFPGEYPFTRGVYHGMYRKAPWRINQYAGFGSPEDTNKRWRFLFERGQMVFNLPFDLPTQLGYDSDNPEIEDEVGREGVAIDTLKDMEALFEGLPLVPVSFNIAGAAAVIMAMYVALGELKGVGPDGVMGAFTNDILTVLVCRGTWIFPPEPHLRIIGDMIEYACRKMSPNFYPLNVQGVYFRSVGANIPQEVAYVLTDALAYVEEGLKKGLHIDEFARRISFFFACGPEFLEEAAKFRAARRLWARLMKERYGAQHKDSLRLKATAATGGRYFQAVEPLNNIVRGAYGILGAALGGAQSTFMAGYDEAFALPNEESALLGLRTLQILQDETDVARTIDPLAGSYYVEDLTNWIESKAVAYMDDIQKHGGVVKAVRDGYMRRRMDEGLYEQLKGYEEGRIVCVGVNKYRQEESREEKLQLHQHSSHVLDLQRKRLKEIRAARSNDEVRRTLGEIRKAAEGKDNLIAPMVDAVKAYATVGEICGALRELWGEFKDPNTGL